LGFRRCGFHRRDRLLSSIGRGRCHLGRRDVGGARRAIACLGGARRGGFGGRRVVVEVELRLRTVGDCCGVAGIGAVGVDLIQHAGRGRVLGGGVLAATTTATATATASTAATAAFRTGFALVRGRRGILRGRPCGRGVHVGCCRGFRAVVLDVVLLRRRGGDGGRSDDRKSVV